MKYEQEHLDLAHISETDYRVRHANTPQPTAFTLLHLLLKEESIMHTECNNNESRIENGMFQRYMK